MLMLAFRKPLFLKHRFPLTATYAISQNLIRISLVLVFFVTSCTVVLAQSNFRVSGKVTQPSGEPLVGATVSEKGASASTITKDDGSFSIDVSNQNATLVISFVGYAAKEIKVNGQPSINVFLHK